jgi:uncharacterized tellurite resistance protein B-like protein
MFDWFKKGNSHDESTEDKLLLDTVQRALPQADGETQQIVAATAGLLSSVAYADRNFSDVEERRVVELLQTIEGMAADSAALIERTLRQSALKFSTVHATRFSRTLRELADRDLRCQVLALLVEVAAADQQITHDEIAVLRQLTTALGLEQADYNAAQEKHKDKLASLR